MVQVMPQFRPIPKFNTPSGLPETFEEFEKLKVDQREALRRFWEAQPESARRRELARIFSRKPEDREPWIDVEVF
jgi:hypothetical protein